MVQPKEKKVSSLPEPNYKWLVHINEGFATTVQSPNVEGAIMQAFAQYWEQSPDSNIFSFDIDVVNLTLYNRATGKKP